MKQILIFGGSFNPPTLAHEAIVQEGLKLQQFNEVWLMPSGERLDKTIGTSDDHRIKMLKIIKKHVFANNPRLVISDFELKLPRPTKTFATVKALRSAYPNVDFYFVFGADSYNDMPNWEQGLQLAKDLKIVLIDRLSKTSAKPVLSIVLPDSFKNISSSAARDSIFTGRDLNNVLSHPVQAYIKQNNLYH